MLNNTRSEWGLVSQALHWGTAALMVLVISLGLIGDYLPNSGEKIKIFVYHKSVGLTILLIVLLRIVWKSTQITPAPAEGITDQQHKLASFGHGVLYLLLLALPISGWMLNSAANFPFKWMDLFAVPHLPGIQETLKDPLILVHKGLFIALAVIALGHIAMALAHHFGHKNRVLLNMLPKQVGAFWLVFAITIGSLTFYVYQQSFAKPDVRNIVDNSLPKSELIAETVEHTDKLWQVLDENRQLKFNNTYEGVEFDGEFSRFDAKMYFDTKNVSEGFFDVNIDISSITTYNEDWDSSLPNEEWFSMIDFPEARYQTTAMRATDSGYQADGLLTLKGVTQAVPLTFTWQERDDGLVEFIAESVVKRTDFGVGSGVWQDDPTIGFDVKVDIKLLLKLVN